MKRMIMTVTPSEIRVQQQLDAIQKGVSRVWVMLLLLSGVMALNALSLLVLHLSHSR